MSFIRLVFNWAAYLTLPIWAGLFFLLMMTWEKISGEEQIPFHLGGDKWFWK